MSRWRAPLERSSPYITAHGYANLEKELEQLWKKRAIVNKALAAAAAEGDRSENAEYIYRKKEQAGLDRRIRYLQKRLPDLKIITQVASKSQVYFGATVTIEDEQGNRQMVRIVGPDETNTHNGDISIDSPLAKVLLKKKIDDEVSLSIQGQSTHYSIISIEYSNIAVT